MHASGEYEQANHLLQDIRHCRASGSPEIEAEIKQLRIEHCLRIEAYGEALSAVNDWIESSKGARAEGTSVFALIYNWMLSTSDLAQRLQLLVLKSKIFATAGQPTKGFSIVLRAALTAERHRLVPVLAAALAVLCTILIALEEFAAGRELLEAILPHVSEE